MFAPTRIFLIRHGATTSTRDDRFAGSSDVELSEDGKLQIQSLFKRLSSQQIDAVYCSDMKRALATATAIATPHKLVPQSNRALREIDHGSWEGRIHKEVEETDAAIYKDWSADPLTFAPPGGETGLAVLERALPALRQIVVKHAGQNVAVISHKATNRLLIAYLLGMDVRRYRERLAQDLACLNILEFSSPTDAKLIVLNDTSHYA